MPFLFDVFLSHSSKDKEVVRKVAERLKKDGLRVWFDEGEAKIEDGLKQSRVLVLCMSANAFGSDWARLEAGTFRFRDPMNRELRFSPLRLDDAEIKGSLAQFLYVDWRGKEGYGKLWAACKPAEVVDAAVQGSTGRGLPSRVVKLNQKPFAGAWAFNKECSLVLAGGLGSGKASVFLMDVETGKTVRMLEGHSGDIYSVAFSPDGSLALSGSADNTARVWDLASGRTVHVLRGHSRNVRSVTFSPDCSLALSGSYDRTVRLWATHWPRPCVRHQVACPARHRR